MKDKYLYLALDIDGVLTSYYNTTSDDADVLDDRCLRILRTLVTTLKHDPSIKFEGIIFYSYWTKNMYPYLRKKFVEHKLSFGDHRALNKLDRIKYYTIADYPSNQNKLSRLDCVLEEIMRQKRISGHVDISKEDIRIIIIDDEYDETTGYEGVKIDPHDGLTYSNYVEVCKLTGTDPDVFVR